VKLGERVNARGCGRHSTQLRTHRSVKFIGQQLLHTSAWNQRAEVGMGMWPGRCPAGRITLAASC